MCWDSLSPCLWLWPYCITWPLVNGEIINNLSWAIMQRQGLWLWNINGNRKRLCVYALWPVNDALIGWPINSQVGNDGHVQGYNPGPPQSLFLFLPFSFCFSLTLSLSHCQFIPYFLLLCCSLSPLSILIQPSSILSLVLHLVYCAWLVSRVRTHNTLPLPGLSATCLGWTCLFRCSLVVRLDFPQCISSQCACVRSETLVSRQTDV